MWTGVGAFHPAWLTGAMTAEVCVWSTRDDGRARDRGTCYERSVRATLLVLVLAWSWLGAAPRGEIEGRATDRKVEASGGHGEAAIIARLRAADLSRPTSRTRSG
jgi:hypothetical protein